MIEKSNKKKQIILSILAIALVLIITGVTYAVFSYSNTSGKNNTINSGQVSMTYSEQSNSYIVENALPKKDIEGMNENNYFEFTVSSSAKTSVGDTIGIQIPYEINISSKTIDDGKQQLSEDNVKIYLTKVEDGKEIGIISPIKISDLGNSLFRENATKVAYKLNSHKNGNETISTTYRLRAWIDYDTDITNWTEDNKYQYKFTVNINSDTKYVGYTTDPSCFTFETQNGKAIITGFSSSCSATNLVIPSTYKKPTVIPEATGLVLLSYTANEEEYIKYSKNSVLEEGQTYEEYLTANNQTDEEFVAEAKEEYKNIIDEMDSFKGKVISETGSTAEEIYTILQDPTNEDYDSFSKIFTINVENKTVPEHTIYEDYEVTTISTSDFANRNIKTVVLPDDIRLSQQAFVGNKIELFTNTDGNLPNGCYTIVNNELDSIYSGCNIVNLDLSSLKIVDLNRDIDLGEDTESIQFPSTLKKISNSIYGGNLKAIDLSNTQLTTIAKNAFQNGKFTTVKLPSTVTSIGDGAFDSNPNLKSIIYPGTTALNWDKIINSSSSSSATHLPPYTYNGVSITAK